MAEGGVASSSVLLESYKFVISSLPPVLQNFINLFLIVFLIFIYVAIIWKLHKFISHKNIFGLNLNKYNRSEEPITQKFVHGSFYFLEYMIILPFIIFFWFAGFAIFLIVMGKGFDANTALIISAAVVASIRMTAYYKEVLSQELAKLLPLNLLALSLIEKGFFDIERIFSQISQIPGLFSNITIYFVFIIILEVILRFFDFTFSMFGLEEEESFWKENEED
ncbi:hypothetical protein HYT25_00415 [Candidatus Pacearchaeota archaeon]|nr:hypothetical protein [Candidatus Pacearchaeota archaeon]